MTTASFPCSLTLWTMDKYTSRKAHSNKIECYYMLLVRICPNGIFRHSTFPFNIEALGVQTLRSDCNGCFGWWRVRNVKQWRRSLSASESESGLASIQHMPSNFCIHSCRRAQAWCCIHWSKVMAIGIVPQIKEFLLHWGTPQKVFCFVLFQGNPKNVFSIPLLFL